MGEASGSEIKGFETITQKGGAWSYQGNYKSSDILIQGGRAEILITDSKKTALTCESFVLDSLVANPGLLIDLSQINSDSDGRWRVIDSSDGYTPGTTTFRFDGQEFMDGSDNNELAVALGVDSVSLDSTGKSLTLVIA